MLAETPRLPRNRVFRSCDRSRGRDFVALYHNPNPNPITSLAALLRIFRVSKLPKSGSLADVYAGIGNVLPPLSRLGFNDSKAAMTIGVILPSYLAPILLAMPGI